VLTVLLTIQAEPSASLTQIPVALGALKDWSAWLVSIQAAIIALATFGLGGTKALEIAPRLLKVGLGCFVASIVCATFVLGAIPSILIRIEEDPASFKNGGFYRMPISGWDRFEKSPFADWLPLKLFTVGEQVLFLIGVVCFALIAIAVHRPSPARLTQQPQRNPQE
jgi:hypothetical protein